MAARRRPLILTSVDDEAGRSTGLEKHAADDQCTFGLLRRRDVPAGADRESLQPDSVTYVLGLTDRLSDGEAYEINRAERYRTGPGCLSPCERLANDRGPLGKLAGSPERGGRLSSRRTSEALPF